MGKTTRPYPTGHFRLYKTSRSKADRPMAVQIEYSFKSVAVRRATGIMAKESEWNPNENHRRGGVRSNYGPDYRSVNNRLLKKVTDLDTAISEWCNKHPGQLTTDIIKAFLDGLPTTREDEGIDFVDFTKEILKSELQRKKIGQSVYKNGLSSLNIFGRFLKATKLGTYAPDKIYVSEISVKIIDEYVKWRREYKENTDETINHALTPLLKGCSQAMSKGYISPELNATIQQMRLAKTVSLQPDASSKVRHLSHEQIIQLIGFYERDSEPRRREYLEIFLFAMYACGLRFVDVMTLQWSDIDLEKRTLNKIQVKTKNRNVIPLSDQAVSILTKWKEKNLNTRFVFDLLPEDFNLDDSEALYKSRNSKTKGINQSLNVVGESIKLPFSLSFHVARHTFAVISLNQGITMTMVSQLLGHSSTEMTEKVYAHFLPAKMADEINRLNLPFPS